MAVKTDFFLKDEINEVFSRKLANEKSFDNVLHHHHNNINHLQSSMDLNEVNFDDSLNNSGRTKRIIQTDLDTEEKRCDFMREVHVTLRKNGSLSYQDQLGLLEVLSQSFSGDLPTTRTVAMELLADAIPTYGGDLEQHMGLLFPQLLQNLLHSNTSVKKFALQLLHIYFKNSKNKDVGLQYLFTHGVNSDEKALRNEVLLAIPALVRSDFDENQLEKIFTQVLKTVLKVKNGDSTLPIVLCLEHIKDITSEDVFQGYLLNLDESLYTVYKTTLEKSSLTKRKVNTSGLSKRTSNGKEHDHMKIINITSAKEKENMVFGIIPESIIHRLGDKNSWQDRSEAIHYFMDIINFNIDQPQIYQYSKELLTYIAGLVDDVHLNVTLSSLTILHQIIMKIEGQVTPHLEMILNAIVKKLNDPKVVIRKLNLRIALTLMNSLSPMVFIQAITPFLQSKNTRTREEIINMVTAALLSFPSSDFDLVLLPNLLTFTLLDSKRRVRHASLECFAIMAQQLGAGRLSPLVSAVDNFESKEGGDGVLVAVQARLGRKTLPRMDEDGLVQYSLAVPANASRGDRFAPDIAWVIAGTGSGSDSSRTDSELSNSTQRRHFSAGKKKLPWQNAQDSSQKYSERKTVGSAPVRQNPSDNELSIGMSNTVIQDSWVTNGNMMSSPADSYLDKFMSKPKMPGNEGVLRNRNNQASYFDDYKTRVKKVKAAGLQADAQMINPNMAFRSMLPSNVRNGREFELAYKSPKTDSLRLENMRSPTHEFSLVSPTNGTISPKAISPVENGLPMKPTLVRSASKSKQKMRLDAKQMDSKKEYGAEDRLAHTIPKARTVRRTSFDDAGSPFPSRPTIHRTPSGRVTLRQTSAGKRDTPESSNLLKMKKLSNSSPVISYTDKAASSPSPDIVSPVGRNHSPRIRTPRAKLIMSPVSADNSPRHKPFQDMTVQTKGESSASSDSLEEKRNEPEHPRTPKLAKSAQEKLRKLKEDRLRQSTDTAIVIKRKKEKRLSRSLDAVPSLKHRNSISESDLRVNPELKLRELKRIHNKDKEEQMQLSKEKQKIDDLIKSQIQERPKVVNYDDIPVGNFKKKRKNKSLNANGSYEVPLPGRRTKRNIDPFDTSDLEYGPEKVQSEWKNEPSSSENDCNYFDSGMIDCSGDLEITGAGMFSGVTKNKEAAMKDEPGKRTSPTDHNNNQGGVQDFMVKGKKQRKSPRTNVQPKVACSPMVTRKNYSSASENLEEVAPPKTYSYSEDLQMEIPNPNQSLPNALQQLSVDTENWESKCDGLITIRRLSRFHPEYLADDLHTIVEAVLKEVKNLRSQVTRLALCAIADMFAGVPKLIEPELEVILKTMLPKASDTNQFIRADFESALNNLVQYVHPGKAIAGIICSGASHRSDLIRKVSAKSLADIAEAVGATRFLSSHKDIIPVTGKLATDKQPDTRYNGRRILLLLLDHPDLDNLLEKRLPSVTLRPVRDVVENLRFKGLEPPNTGSATLRRSTRTLPSPATSRKSRNRSTTQTSLKESQADNHVEVQTQRSERSSGVMKKGYESRGGVKAAIDMECLSKLDSSKWNERYEGLDDFFELCSHNPSGVASHVIKVFDKLCPRLSDPNSKVNLYALQTLNRCIPILRNGMSSAATLLIDSLKGPLSSKNDAMYQAAKECVISLTKYVDNSALLQPLVTSVQYGNTRNKPELAERLADIIEPVFSRKPGLIHRLVLPLLWNLLSTQSSGAVAPGRANLQQSLTRICNILYGCLGKELIDEASTKGSRASQRLESILQADGVD